MMTFREYVQTDEKTRENLFWSNESVFIAERLEGKYMFSLFQLYGFYIEVIHNVETSFITRISAFENMSRIDPYLSSIPIEIL